MGLMQGGKLIEILHPDQHYRTVFNQQTGFFVRKEENGWPEPAWAVNGPELIDLSITSYCHKGCSFCYRRANDEVFHHLSLEEVKRVVDQAAECGTLQMALGGGNPNQHPDFIPILRLIRDNGIVPSYTTNGDGITDEILKATADYCGAMAVSVYAPFNENYYGQLLAEIKRYGIKLNLHAIIRNDYLDMWTRLLSEPPSFLKNVNAIIFLNYKPLGRDGSTLLPKDIEKTERFFKAANDSKKVKVGFDSCSISGIAKWMDVPKFLIESCEAARFSAFISEDMKMYPCSFMVDKGYCGDLRKESLLDIWQKNVYFLRFRENTQPVRCEACKYSDVCKGGCKMFDEINFC